jgi:hypothetical protein
MTSRHIRISGLIAVLIAAPLASPLVAQGVSAQLSGTVKASSGAAVAGATVVIRNSETGFVRTVQTDATGRYVATALPVGPYTVGVTKAGFQAASNIKVNLNLGDAAPLNIKLAQESSTTVEVVASVSKVDSDRSSAATFISTDALANLPVFNRSFTSLATSTPQVVVDSQRGNLAIAGQRGVNTSINIDGGDNNEPFFGGALGAGEGKTPFTISIEAIREYQVVTDGASAEFGRMGGGYVNAITKNGTNDIGGSVFYYTRPQSLVARQPNLNGIVDSNKVFDFKQQQMGFSIGGPIIKDKLFYFIAYDGQRQTSPYNMVWGGNTPVTLNPANVNDAVLISKAGAYSSQADSDAIFARLDWNINVDHSLQFRINHSKFNGDVGAGITAAKENLSSDIITTDSYVLQWNWVINANWMNEARVNYTKDDMPRVPYSTIPEVSISGVGFYGAYPFDRTYNTKRVQFQDNVSYVTPVVQIRAGIDYNSIDVSEFFAGSWRGIYMFNNLADFETGKWTTYRQNFGLSSPVTEAGLFSANTKQTALYVQSDWRILDSLKMGLGLRWDRQTNPDYPILDMSNKLANPMPLTAKIPSDSQISPRFSLTWTPEADHGKTVVRGNLGRYVSVTPSVFLYQVFAANSVRTGSKDFKAADSVTFGIPRGDATSNTGGGPFNAANPYWIPSYPSGATKATVDIFSFDPNFKNPYTDRANLAVERAFDDLLLGVSGTYAKANQLERTQDFNLGTPTMGAYGRLIYPTVRPNTGYLRIVQYKSDATSLYHAYTFSAKYHKDGSNLDAQLFYTYSINKDTDSNERNYSGVSVQDGALPGNDWSYADTDRRHILTGYVSYKEARWSGILASLSFRYLSGFPYTLTYSKDVNGDSNTGNDRLFLNGMDTERNTQRSASNMTMDLGLRRDFHFTKTMKLTLSADVFNLMNRHDTYTRQFVSNSTSTGGISSDAAPILGTSKSVVGSARQVQLGVRFAF